MASRSKSLSNISTILSLTFAIFILSIYSTLLAQTYTVPQTAEVTVAWDPVYDAVNDNLAGNVIVYEEAEDGNTTGWDIYDNSPTGALITNVYDADRSSSVIQIVGSGTENGYRLRNDDGSKWQNTTHFVIEWSMRYFESFVVYIDLQTTSGHRYLQYEPYDDNSLGIDEYVKFGIGSNATDGQWRTFTRDLQADLELAQPGVEILSVDGFLIRGSGKVDDIKLNSALSSDAGITYESPYGYRIYQRIDGQVYDYSEPVWTGSNTSCTIYNLNYDTTYFFVVRAYVGIDESGDSNEISFSAPSSSTNNDTVSHTISASISGNGSISPTGTVTVANGADQTFTITPNSDSDTVDVLVDGVSKGAVSSYTFSQVAQNHTISASFAYKTHTISASAGTGGSISPSGSVSVTHGNSQGYTITPSTGYKVAGILVDGISVGPYSSYTFDQVVEDHTIRATFIADIITITSSADANGTITPSGSVTIPFGGSQTFAIYPDSGYTISDVVVDGVSMGSKNSYTFSSVSGNHTINAVFATANQAPIADAGPDQTVDEGQTVTLSALNSDDMDDGIATFQWRQIQGESVNLLSPDKEITTFTTPNVDSSGDALVFELTATDHAGATSTDSCIVNVTWVNAPPIADAGVDQTVAEGSQVVLDASKSSGTDDGIASYGWRQVSGPAVTISDANSATPSFVAPDVESAGASLAFEVTATDTGGLQDTAKCLVNVTWVNTPPVADAGPDQNSTIGDEVVLDGSKSYDAEDNEIKAYKWSQTSGVPVELSDATAQRPVFVVPTGADKGGPMTFELTVTDSGGLQGKDSSQANVQSLSPALHVSMISMELKQKGPSVEASAYVTIVDEFGNIAKGANVTGVWTYNGSQLNTATSTSRGDGTAVLYSDKISAKSNALFAVEITGVVMDGYFYDPASNTVTQESLFIP